VSVAAAAGCFDADAVSGVPCCDGDTFEAWRELAKLSAPPRAGFCTDCLPEFQRMNIDRGTCAHPEVCFRVDADGFVEGYFPKPERAKHDRARARLPS